MWGVYLLRNLARNSMIMSKKFFGLSTPLYPLCIFNDKCPKMKDIFSVLRVPQTTFAFKRAENG